MKTKYKLKQSTSNFKNHFVRDSKVVVAGTLFMFMLLDTTNVFAVSYKIVYDDNVTSNMPEDVKSTTMNDSVNISSETPTRDGYTFLKWCTQPPASDGTCPGTEYSAGASLAISGVSKNEYGLYVMWKKNPTMQTWSGCSAMSAGDTITLTDNRDGENYLVGKLADDKCWMLDNLRLDPTSISLDTLRGNANADNATLDYLKNGGGGAPYASVGVIAKTASGGSWANSYELPYIATSGNDEGGWTKNTATISYGPGSGKIGVYYNYCAASAGSYCYPGNSSSGNASQDLCPKGWRLPTGGYGGEYAALYAAYSDNATDFRDALSTPLSGHIYSGWRGPIGDEGFFMSSTRNTDTDMHTLYVSSDKVSLVGSNFRAGGYSIRCVSQ